MAPESEPVPHPTPEAEPAAKPGPALAVFAHPDDAEIAAGGTLARWSAEGRHVHLLVLTNGDRGASKPLDRAELAETRKRETEVAARFLGLEGATVLDNHDGELDNTADVRREIVRVIRRVRPQVVVSCDPTVVFFGNRYFNHADHRTAGMCALDAVFPAAGNALYFEELLGEGLEPWNVPEVWLGWTLEPNHHQDVTGFMDAKLQALALHESQVAGDQLGFFEQWLPTEAEEAGRKIGVQHAEAFRVLHLD
jgi:LmbE family N-acetylglucosaminyl deacetylase